MADHLTQEKQEKQEPQERQEQKKRKGKDNRDLEKKQKKQAKKQDKKQKKKGKHADALPPDRRPLICPPDRSNRSLSFRIVGTVCRILVIWVLVLGLTVFLCDAFNMGQTAVELQKAGSTQYAAETQADTGTLVGGTLLIVAVVSLVWLGGKYTAIGGGCTAAWMLYAFLTKPDYFGFLIGSAQTLYNSVLARLAANNYRSALMEQLRVDIRTVSGYGEAAYKTTGLLLLATAFALFLVPFLLRKVRLIPPAVLCAGILVTVFTMNISRGTVGISLLLVAFVAVLVVFAYDRIYAKKAKQSSKYDMQTEMIADEERPQISAALAERVRQGGKTPAAKKEKKEYRRQVRALAAYDRATARSRAASGGIAGFIMLVLSAAVILIPAVTIREKLEIPWLSAKFNYAREFVTALLQGDETTLDLLDYESNAEAFAPHDTTAKKQEFDGTQIMHVQTRSNLPVYFRGWVATDYTNGAWYLEKQVEEDGSEAIDNIREYRSLFGAESFPDESMKVHFFQYNYADRISILLNDPETEGKTDYTGKVRSFDDLGFTALLVSVRRINLRSSLAYLPSYYDYAYRYGGGVLKYGSLEPDEKTFVNYFDGIYTGRSFYKTQTADTPTTYASVTFAPTMKKDWAKSLSQTIASYNLQKEAMLIQSYTEDTLSAEISVDGRTQIATVTYRNGTTVILQTTHDANTMTVFKEGRVLFSDTAGTLSLETIQVTQKQPDVYTNVYTLPSITSVRLNGVLTADGEESMLDWYAEATAAEQTEVQTYFDTETAYADFVYRTYSRTADSTIIGEVADAVLQYTDADRKVASMRTSTDVRTYEERDKLVRAVIDYIIDTENGLGCTYSLEVESAAYADPALDGVENFLTVTHEGYCVQFASAAALLLREYGIPTRYAEGYIAHDFERASRKDPFTLGTYVHDYDAHAWIEVWYDGIGWVQYETTPYYYAAMYGEETQTPGTDIGKDPLIEVTTEEKTTEQTTEQEVYTDENGDQLTPEEVESLLAEESRLEEERRRQRQITIGAFIFIGVCAVILAIILLLRGIANRAKRAEDLRIESAETVLSERFGRNSTTEERHELAISLIDAINALLRAYGMMPEIGEFRDAYAKRLSFALAEIFGKPTEYEDFESYFANLQKEKNKRGWGRKEPPRLEISDLCIGDVLEAIAAEEFGHGMTVAQMKQVANFYLKLRGGVYKYTSFMQRFVLHYIKRQL